MIQCCMTLSPLGVDLKTMSYDIESEKTFRTHHGIGNKLIIVNAGKQYPGKRIDWIIDVAVAVKNMGVDLCLILVGNAEPEYDEFINKKLADLGSDHRRLPLLERKELQKVYSAADIGIWPGVPSITIQEAMACGVAMILPDDNIVGHLVNGNGLHESENVTNAAAFISELSLDSAKLNLSKTNSMSIVRKYDWFTVSRDLIDLYAESNN